MRFTVKGDWSSRFYSKKGMRREISMALGRAGNLLVVDDGNANCEFTVQGARSIFAKGDALGETFSYVGFQPSQVCC